MQGSRGRGVWGGGGGGWREAEVWKSEKDGHEAWQHPSLLLFFFSASFLDNVIHWAARSSAPVSPVGVGEADMQYLLKWSRGDSCESLLLGCSLKTNMVLEGILGLLIMSQGLFRNNPSLRTEIGKWSVKVDRLERITHTDWARGC